MSEAGCYHCGDDVIGRGIRFDDKAFCCNGCKSVYQLLKQNDLGSFYTMEQNAGTRPKESNEHKYAFLDVPTIREKQIDFEDDISVHVTLFLPQIHCSSCIYLLENLQRIEPAVKSCQVNFAKREASIVFVKENYSLKELAALLDKIGYTPNFGSRKEIERKQNYTYLYKLGVAGFAFGSIMLWSFPEYLGIANDNPEFRSFTSFLSFGVSVPVLLYSAREYFISAWKALKFRSINLDVPITIGIIALYAQSVYSIFTAGGPGYIDSFAGFIFFLLIGKWFQNKTYKSLSFERDYTSYFPVAVTRIVDEDEEIVEIEKLNIGDKILIRNEEVVPCDSVLESDEATIDYSFVTGESLPIHKKKGDFIYAGGKLCGTRCTLTVQKESNRSHLTQLWNETKKDDNSVREETGDKLPIYFLSGVLIVATLSGVYWMITDITRATQIVVAVLIVACPCALALSGPFTFGNVMRLLGRRGLYLKNTGIVKRMNSIDTIVFDKTGTLTTGDHDNLIFSGKELNQEEKAEILSLANSSTHPLSRAIVKFLRSQQIKSDFDVLEFKEVSGKGIEGEVNGKLIKLGSSLFVQEQPANDSNETATYLSINDEFKGKFIVQTQLRDGMGKQLNQLAKKYDLHILSGDKDKDKEILMREVPELKHLHFNQTPGDKLKYIKDLQKRGKKVMMVGDGLNDSGALETAEVGIAVSEDIFRFTPSSDAIIEGSYLTKLDKLLGTAGFSKTVLKICLAFSILYNSVGLLFAVTGQLTPLFAAILMPLSSITIVFISTFLVRLRK